ncbi:hypothetical protein Riv7116_6898 [Rivularia sp. PCC 7116]|uniref:hypothetical protein n=1 Tax=Rivularia sp. PCC 7116 TaxID=373994 RepID=UPI00029EE7D2|nr:hypothetical protein [Rivularia sp. PCC 7116]AFY59211.1 hypothetical protein Riv7116_6898 [Rivularia sp. PCC 7116]
MTTIQKKPAKKSIFFSKYLSYSNCLIAIFFIVSLIGIINHEMWRDETQAWLIARDSSTLIDLYQNLKYEGHQGLWHLCLFIIAKFTHNPFAMQLFHILIATASVYLIVKFSPFNILQKTFLSFSYFSLFEYNLISRNYNLGLFLVLLFCYLFTSKNRNYIAISSTLAFLANTNIYSLLISLCLTATLMIDLVDKNFKQKNQLNRRQQKYLKIGFIIIILGISFSIFQLIPVAILDTANDINKSVSQSAGEDTVAPKPDLILIILKRLNYSIRAIFNSYLPIPNFLKYHFWSDNIMSNFSLMRFSSSFFSLLLLCFSIFIFIQTPKVLLLYLSGTFGIILFTWLKWQGTLRHHGNLFILFIACLWISKLSDKSDIISKYFRRITHFSHKYQKKAIAVILLIQMLSGLYAYSMDLIYPFSKSQAAANFIQKQNLSDKFILADRDTIVSPISAYLDKKIFYLAYDKLGSFFFNPKVKFIQNQSELIEKVENLAANNSRENLLILGYPLNIKSQILKISLVGQFSNAIVAEENYYIYIIENIQK